MKAVFCIAKNIDQTEIIVSGLKAAGFSSNDISVLFTDKSTTKDFAHEKHTKAPEGASIGGAVGIGTGAVLGWLAGIGSLAIPGVGPFIAAGPIMAALGGAAVGAGGHWVAFLVSRSATAFLNVTFSPIPRAR